MKTKGTGKSSAGSTAKESAGTSNPSVPKMVIVPGSSVMATRSSNMQKDRDGSFIYRRRQSLPLAMEARTPDFKGEMSVATRSHGKDEKGMRCSQFVMGGRAADRKRSAAAIDSDSESQTVSSSVAKRRRTIRKLTNGMTVESDAYCWVCHEEGSGVCCELCPRLYHTKCLGVEAPPEDQWICPECEQVMKAENIETRSKAMSMISVDTLCTLLKYVVQRMRFPETEPFHRPVDSASVPTYTDYVFHPMDFSTLEKNIRKKQYGSTEAFVADVKWILHNCTVFNGKKHSLTNAAKTVVKICRHETSDIEICPDCYMNFCLKNENWFCQPCRVPHTLVWAKMKGYPFWPGKVLRVENSQVDVRFFGEHDRTWMPVSHVFLLSKDPPSLLKGKQGFEAAMGELEQHLNIIREKFGSFEYAPHRTPLDPFNAYKSMKLSTPPKQKSHKRLSDSTSGDASEFGDPAADESSSCLSTPEAPPMKTVDKPQTSVTRKRASAVKLKYSSIISTRRASNSDKPSTVVILRTLTPTKRESDLKKKYSDKAVFRNPDSDISSEDNSMASEADVIARGEKCKGSESDTITDQASASGDLNTSSVSESIAVCSMGELNTSSISESITVTEQASVCDTLNTGLVSKGINGNEQVSVSCASNTSSIRESLTIYDEICVAGLSNSSADTVTVDNVNADNVTADNVTADNVTADNVTADNVTADNITAADDSAVQLSVIAGKTTAVETGELQKGTEVQELNTGTSESMANETHKDIPQVLDPLPLCGLISLGGESNSEIDIGNVTSSNKQCSKDSIKDDNLNGTKIAGNEVDRSISEIVLNELQNDQSDEIFPATRTAVTSVSSAVLPTEKSSLAKQDKMKKGRLWLRLCRHLKLHHNRHPSSTSISTPVLSSTAMEIESCDTYAAPSVETKNVNKNIVLQSQIDETLSSDIKLNSEVNDSEQCKKRARKKSHLKQCKKDEPSIDNIETLRTAANGEEGGCTRPDEDAVASTENVSTSISGMISNATADAIIINPLDLVSSEMYMIQEKDELGPNVLELGNTVNYSDKPIGAERIETEQAKIGESNAVDTVAPETEVEQMGACTAETETLTTTSNATRPLSIVAPSSESSTITEPEPIKAPSTLGLLGVTDCSDIFMTTECTENLTHSNEQITLSAKDLSPALTAALEKVSDSVPVSESTVDNQSDGLKSLESGVYSNDNNGLVIDIDEDDISQASNMTDSASNQATEKQILASAGCTPLGPNTMTDSASNQATEKQILAYADCTPSGPNTMTDSTSNQATEKQILASAGCTPLGPNTVAAETATVAKTVELPFVISSVMTLTSESLPQTCEQSVRLHLDDVTGSFSNSLLGIEEEGMDIGGTDKTSLVDSPVTAAATISKSPSNTASVKTSAIDSMATSILTASKSPSNVVAAISLPPLHAAAVSKVSKDCAEQSAINSSVSVEVPEGQTVRCVDVSPVSSMPDLTRQTITPSSTAGTEEHFEFNISGFDFSKYTTLMIESAQRTLVEFCSDVMKADIGSAVRKHMDLEQKRMEWAKQQEINEIRHNAAVAQSELRLTLEYDKELALAEQRERFEVEKNKAVEETKKKQWCANCGKEAIFYCCWNTSYCNYPCQQAHWPKHMHMCTQSSDSPSSQDPTPSQSEEMITAPSSRPQRSKSDVAPRKQQRQKTNTPQPLQHQQSQQQQQQQIQQQQQDHWDQRQQQLSTGGSLLQAGIRPYITGQHNVSFQPIQYTGAPDLQSQMPNVAHMMPQQHHLPILQSQYTSSPYPAHMASYSGQMSGGMVSNGSRLSTGGMMQPIVMYPRKQQPVQIGRGGIATLAGNAQQLMLTANRLLQPHGPAGINMNPYAHNY